MNRQKIMHLLSRPAIMLPGLTAAYLVVLGFANMPPLKGSVTATSFYQVKSRQLWGDYGRILINGMGGRLSRSDDRIQLERTGPFMPPVTFPRDPALVVTDAFRKRLAKSGLAKPEFVKVIKARIVDLQWQRWDLKAEDPPAVPETGEPEDYILGRPHSQKLAEEMGDVWEVVLRDGAIVDTEIERGPADYDVRVHVETWNGDDLFWGRLPNARPRSNRWVVVTERGKQWLEENAGEWVRFKPLPVK